MQISKMYAIYDDAAGAYMTPFFFGNDLLAIRAIAPMVNDAGHLFGQSTSDFTLYCLAVFDASTGEVVVENKPRPVRALSALVERDVNPAQGELPLPFNASGERPIFGIEKESK